MYLPLTIPKNSNVKDRKVISFTIFCRLYFFIKNGYIFKTWNLSKDLPNEKLKPY